MAAEVMPLEGGPDTAGGELLDALDILQRVDWFDQIAVRQAFGVDPIDVLDDVKDLEQAKLSDQLMAMRVAYLVHLRKTGGMKRAEQVERASAIAWSDLLDLFKTATPGEDTDGDQVDDVDDEPTPGE